MNAIVKEAIAEGLAALPRVAEPPSGGLGFGADISCAYDCLESMPDIDDPKQILGEAIARRLDCPRGANPDDLNYGVDLREALHRPATASELRDRQTSVESELRKDDRIDSVSTRLVLSPRLDAMTLTALVTPRDPALGGPFSLTFALTDAGLALEEIGA